MLLRALSSPLTSTHLQRKTCSLEQPAGPHLFLAGGCIMLLGRRAARKHQRLAVQLALPGAPPHLVQVDAEARGTRFGPVLDLQAATALWLPCRQLHIGTFLDLARCPLATQASCGVQGAMRPFIPDAEACQQEASPCHRGHCGCTWSPMSCTVLIEHPTSSALRGQPGGVASRHAP